MLTNRVYALKVKIPPDLSALRLSKSSPTEQTVKRRFLYLPQSSDESKSCFVTQRSAPPDSSEQTSALDHTRCAGAPIRIRCG